MDPKTHRGRAEEGVTEVAPKKQQSQNISQFSFPKRFTGQIFLQHLQQTSAKCLQATQRASDSTHFKLDFVFRQPICRSPSIRKISLSNSNVFWENETQFQFMTASFSKTSNIFYSLQYYFNFLVRFMNLPLTLTFKLMKLI